MVNGQGTHTAVAFTCSATGCNEAIISGIEGKILIVNNGKYSERLKKMAEVYGIPMIEVKFDPYRQIDMILVEKTLKQNPDVTHIVMVHHETTTGMLTPLKKIGQFARKYNKVLVADTVSSFGGHKIDVKECNLAFCTVSANKCLEGFPGVSFVIADKKELKKMEGKSRSFYFNLYKEWKAEEGGQTSFTPAVQIFFALDKALEELLKEGVENRIKRYRANAKKMREGLKKLGFKFLLPSGLRQSNVMTVLRTPKNMDYWKAHDRLKAQGYTIYTGKEILKRGIFRVATMGCLTKEDIDDFLKALKETLKKK